MIHDLELPKRAELIQAFTAFTFDLHEKGVLFQDHSPGNTLICWEGERPVFYLVDLNRMIFTNLNRAQRIQNFARLTPPPKTMTDQMSEVYARLAQWPEDALKIDMWRVTENFQKRFHRKRRLKRNCFFGVSPAARDNKNNQQTITWHETQKKFPLHFGIRCD